MSADRAASACPITSVTRCSTLRGSRWSGARGGPARPARRIRRGAEAGVGASGGRPGAAAPREVSPQLLRSARGAGRGPGPGARLRPAAGPAAAGSWRPGQHSPAPGPGPRPPAPARLPRIPGRRRPSASCASPGCCCGRCRWSTAAPPGDPRPRLAASTSSSGSTRMGPDRLEHPHAGSHRLAAMGVADRSPPLTPCSPPGLRSRGKQKDRLMRGRGEVSAPDAPTACPRAGRCAGQRAPPRPPATLQACPSAPCSGRRCAP